MKKNNKTSPTMTKIINIDELASILFNINSPTPAKIFAETIPSMSPKNNPYFKNTVKLSEKMVKIAFNYTEDVNIQRAAEGKDFDFIANSRKWGKKIGNTPIVVHNGVMYMETCLLKNLKTCYFYNGKKINENSLIKFFPPKRHNTNQKLKNQIIINDFKLTSIKQIQIGNINYIVR